jgi:hypothetical protein
LARRVFFSFEYGDVGRAMVVRNSWVTQGRDAAGFVDAAEFERLKRLGDAAIQRWIDGQLTGTSVTVVLVGQLTCSSRWVNYEIAKSKALRHGLLGIDISKIPDWNRRTTELCGQIPSGYPFYRWYKDDGFHHMGSWIEEAARDVGR